MNKKEKLARIQKIRDELNLQSDSMRKSSLVSEDMFKASEEAKRAYMELLYAEEFTILREQSND